MSSLTAVAGAARSAPSAGLELVRAHLAAIAAIVRRDATIRLSYRGALITENVGIIFTLAVFYYISKLVKVPQFGSRDAYFAFAVVGIITFGIIYSALGIPQVVRQELVAGTFERLVLSPFGVTAAIGSLLIFPVLLAVVVGTLQLMLAVIVFGLHIQWSSAALALPIAAAGAFAFAPFALVFAAGTLAFKQAPGQSMAVGVVSFVSGMYFPVALLPGWIHWASEVQPLTPTIDLLRNVLLGSPLPESGAAAVAKIAGFALVGIPLALLLVARAARHGAKRGTLIEY